MKRAIITGASSGIGLALAEELSRRGWGVALLARRTDLLNDAVSRLSNAATAITCDVTDAASVADAVRRSEETLGGPLDLAVANAGISYPTHAATFDAVAAAEIIRVNVVGTINLFGATVPSMIARRSGRFAGVASLAGHRGLPTASAYSASKAAMHAFLEASRVELSQYDVGVTIVNPGFIETAMTAKNRFRMPFLWKVDRAARVIADGLERQTRGRVPAPDVDRHARDAPFPRLLVRRGDASGGAKAKRDMNTRDVRLWSLVNVFFLWLARPSVVELSERRCVIKIPLNWRTRRRDIHAMYLGVLCMGADVAAGLIAFDVVRRRKARVSFIFKDIRGEFLKRAEGDVHFTNEDGEKIVALIERALASGERHEEMVRVTATVPKKLGDEPVARFELTLSIKRR